MEDLWAFNEETVAEAIHDCSIPVISAVGHETDFSISDFVADLRAPTPSAAAELAVPDRAELLAALSDVPERLARVLRRENGRRRERLASLTGRPVLTRPETILRDRMQGVASLSERAAYAVRASCAAKREGFTALGATLAALNPLATLSRGYAVAENETGKTVSSVADVSVGERIGIVLSDGTLSTVVESKQEKRS